MKISLCQIKDVLKAIRDIEFDGVTGKDGKIDIKKMLDLADEDKINEICSIITNTENNNYTDDIFGDDGALEVVASFLLSIIDKITKSKSTKKILESLTGLNLGKIVNQMKAVKANSNS